MIAVAIGSIPGYSVGSSTLTVSPLGRTGDHLWIAWSPSTDSSFLRYEIYMKSSTDPSYGLPNCATSNINIRAFVTNYYHDWQGINHSFQPMTSYSFKVRDVDSFGYTDSAELTMSTTQNISLAQPSLIGNGFSLTWTNPVWYGSAQGFRYVFDHYSVYRAIPGQDWSLQATITDEAQLSWSDNSILPGQEYSYNILTVDSIQVESTGAVLVYDFVGPSNIVKSTFPTIKVTSPVDGNLWQVGTEHMITWTSQGSVDEVKIDLYFGDYFESTIATSVLNSGSYDWYVSPEVNVFPGYWIKITSLSDPSVYGESDGAFSVIGNITVTSPTGGEKWSPGSSHIIEWTSVGKGIGVVRIDVYNGTTLVCVVSTETLDNGTYVWTVPKDIALGTNYTIKITGIVAGISDADTYGYSNGSFSIVKKEGGALNLLSPVTIGIGAMSAMIIIVGALLLVSRKRKRPLPVAPVPVEPPQVQALPPQSP